MNTERRVLLIAKNSEHTTTLQQLLHQAGYAVHLINDGAEGWHYALTNPSDIILLAVELKTLDGFQVLMHLKREPITATIPVIMLMSRAWIHEWRLASKLGASFCLCPEEYISDADTAQRLLAVMDRAMHACRVRHQGSPVESTQDQDSRVDADDMAKRRITMLPVFYYGNINSTVKPVSLRERAVGES